MSKFLCVLLAAWLFTDSTVFADSPKFKQVDAMHKLQFPQDHGAHPDYSTEWWYFVGHLRGERGQTFGFELTFFRVGIDPAAKSPSHWRHHSLYLTHFALTDDQNQTFYHDERTNRGAFNQAGASKEDLEVWNGDWKAVLRGQHLILQAASEEFSMRLELAPLKPLVLHGQEGFSQKGPESGQASYYSSFTRLKGIGSVRIGEKEIQLQDAQAWMDHEVTSAGLPENIAGWDWFAIQLDNNEELMLYQLRTKDKKKDRFSKGSYIREDGTIIPLKHHDYSIEAIGAWKSPKTGIVYPSGWTIEVKKTGYRFELTPTVAAQELLTEKSTGVNYWEGRCLVKGEREGRMVQGSAYAELTGYDKALSYRS